MPLKLTKKGATATTTVEHKSSGETVAEESKQEQVDLPKDMAADVGGEGPWCEVGVEASFTKNLGNYQSARFQVTLKIPCQFPEIDETFEFGKNWVDQKLASALEDDE